MASPEKVKRLLSKIRSQNERLQVLNKLVELTSEIQDTYLLLKEILLLGVKATGVEKGFIILYNEENENPFEYGATNTSEQFSDKTILRDICDNVIRTQKPVIINDSRLHKRLRRCNIRNIIAVPLVFDKKPVGVFIIINKFKGMFKKRDLIIFTMISKFTASAIEHTKSYTELDEKNQELAAIYAVDQIRDTIKDFNTMMDSTLKELAKSIDAKLAFFLLYDKKTQNTDVKVSGQLKTSSFVKNNYNQIYDMSKTTLDKGELTDFSKVNKDIYSAICTPIVVGEEKMGVFGVINSNKQTGFGRVDRNVLNAVACQADSAVYEDLEKSEIKKVFGRYVSPEVIDSMMEQEDTDFLKNERKEITVLFSDVRGFTSMSEKLEAEEVVEILNEHFEAMSAVILKQRGTLDKFVGDEIMALFGAPVYVESHALKAIKTALEMQKAQKALSQKIKRKTGVYVDIGIGINTGDMIVGNIGCTHKTDYTVIGDNVNIAARLCDAAPPGEILITEQTYAEVKKLVEVEEAEPLKAKGKSKPLTVYKVIGLVKV